MDKISIEKPENWDEFRRFLIMKMPAEIAYSKIEEIAGEVLRVAIVRYMEGTI